MARKEFTKNKPNFLTRKILIISEDEKSFLNYSKKLLLNCLGSYRSCNKNKIKHPKHSSEFFKMQLENKVFIEIEVRHCGKSNPLGIINHAKEESKNYEKIYCVFDWVSRGGDKTGYNQAISCKVNDNIKKIVSVPAYEFWLLLHFSNSSAGYKKNDELIRKLEQLVSKELGKKFEYNKSELSEELFELLNKKFETAIENAKKIEKSNRQTNTKNPSTTIHHLIEDIQNNFE
jgi:hypothetical protein